MPEGFGPARLAAFGAGLGAIVLAVASPLDALAGRLLVAHMAQHQLLMMVAPPLLWLGAPVAPMLRGLPRWIRRALAALLATPSIRRIAGVMAHPGVGSVPVAIPVWTWHPPGLF